MSDADLYKETTQLRVDRGIFGIQEVRSDDQLLTPAWLELPMDDTPVRITRGAVRFVSLVGTHRPSVTVEIRRNQSQPAEPGFELIGHGRYQTYSGEARIWTMDGPDLNFSLTPDAEYELNVWRKGGDTARERYDELSGVVHPLIGLEEYLIQFSGGRK
ncbi:hypothetical protein [Streptomyces sp. NPDC012746]|uniref:hypothetical protein n=1 Tax=Streptomyces sp. NPDC012746 TaxID=3364845 RepID=UPI0036C4CDF4